MVEEVMDERKPNTQENGSERAIAPVPIFATCMYTRSLEPAKQFARMVDRP